MGGIAHADVLRGGGSNRDEEDLRGDYGPDSVEAAFLKALRPKQLRGLALARSGADHEGPTGPGEAIRGG